MSVRQYIGARYVPIFSDPIQWDNTLSYEPLTVVMNEGSSYVSKQSVPPGVDITNTNYWILWADYNAQIEAYREEVRQYNGRIEALELGLPVEEYDSDNTVNDAITNLNTALSNDIANLNTALSEDIADISNLLPANAFSSTNTIDHRFDTIEANGWVNTNRISDGAVTSAKIADGTIATGDIENNAITTAKVADGSITKVKESKKKIILFGDSWVTNDNNAWPGRLASALNMTLVDYAQGGMGWSYGANNVLNQVNNASADNEAEIVIAMAGVNDVREGIPYNTYKTAIVACANAIRTKYTKARCYIIPINIPSKVHSATNSAFDSYYYNVFTDVELRYAPIALVDIVNWFQPLAPYNVWTSDNLHMSEYGNEIFCNLMYGIINGSTLGGLICKYPLTAASGVTVYGSGLEIKDGMVMFDVSGLTIPSTSSGNTITIGSFNFSQNSTPYYSRKNVSDIFIPVMSMSDSSGAYVGKLQLKENGSLTFTAGTTVSGNIAPLRVSWPVAR